MSLYCRRSCLEKFSFLFCRFSFSSLRQDRLSDEIDWVFYCHDWMHFFLFSEAESVAENLFWREFRALPTLDGRSKVSSHLFVTDKKWSSYSLLVGGFERLLPHLTTFLLNFFFLCAMRQYLLSWELILSNSIQSWWSFLLLVCRLLYSNFIILIAILTRIRRSVISLSVESTILLLGW